MRTDKQVFKVFEARPEWLFRLAGLPSPGRSTLRSFVVKALERTSDGLVVPEAPAEPLTLVEFQFQKDDTIYLRTVVEMAAVQEAYPGRAVQGVIFFGYNNLDPRTAPWTQVVRSCVLSEALAAWEQEEPRHPLVAVFQPLLAESEEGLEREAAAYYRAIKDAQLTATCKRALEDVFVSWLQQRLKKKQKKEIEAMLVGELPDLEETASGKDLIRIGEARGRVTIIMAFLAEQYGPVPAPIEEKIAKLNAAEADALVRFLPKCQTLDELARWLATPQA